jgi:hypothetical protein
VDSGREGVEQPARRRRIAIAALLLCVVLATMLITIRFTLLGPEEPSAVREEVAPVGDGVTRLVSNLTEWDQAVAAAQPGDVLRLTATINARLVYRGDNDGGTASGADGTAGAPIVITADPGVWIDPGNTASGNGALDILYVNHVHAVGVNVRNSQFGIRCMQCHGSDGAPIRLASNTITQLGHAGIHFAGHWSTHAPSSHGLIESNVITNTGLSHPAYGEGVYVGHGGTEWIDVTSDVTVRGNDISYTGAEGIDIKPGTRNILVEGNFVHDLAPHDGGAISAHYVSVSPNPHISQLDPVTVSGNWIWNVNLAGVSGSNDWAIWVGHGGVDIIGNVIWGLRDDYSKTRAVRVRATQPFGPHPIRIEDNVMWTARGWVAEGMPSGVSNVSASGNFGVDASSAEIPVGSGDFIGPVPALGASGTADSGGGPGSGLLLSSGPATTAVPTTAQAPATTAPPTTAAADSPATTAVSGGAVLGLPTTTVLNRLAPEDGATTTTTTTGAGELDRRPAADPLAGGAAGTEPSGAPDEAAPDADDGLSGDAAPAVGLSEGGRSGTGGGSEELADGAGAGGDVEGQAAPLVRTDPMAAIRQALATSGSGDGAPAEMAGIETEPELEAIGPLDATTGGAGDSRRLAATFGYTAVAALATAGIALSLRAAHRGGR